MTELPRKIYLSGPDGAGKTTAAHALEDLGYKIMKWSKPQPGEDYVKKALEQIESPEMMVLDRGWFGDIIYSQIFKTTPVITKADAIMLLKKFTEAGGKLFYVTADVAVLQSRIAQRGDAYVKPADMPLINRLYDEWFAELTLIHKIPYGRIDTTNLF